MSDPIKSIGRVLEAHECERDAIHIAILPAIAGETIYAGREVKLAYGTTNTVLMYMDHGDASPSIGIADPFIRGEHWRIEKGERFWVFLHPNSVNGMRHEWTHPIIDALPASPKNEHEAWLRQFAERWNFNWDQLINAGLTCDYVVAGGIDLHDPSELGDDFDLFWEHLEGHTGQKFDVSHRNSMGWSCSC